MKIFEKIKRYAALSTGNFEKIFGNKEVPVLPEAVMKLNEALQEPECDVKKIANIINSDPGLSVEILKVANSAFFGFKSEIKTVQQAVSALGLRNIESIAVAYGVQKAVKNPDVGGFDFNLFWSTSLYRALVSRELSKELKMGSPDEAFVAALLQDIALPVLLKEWFNEYKMVYETWLKEKRPLSEIENEKLSWNHAQAGAWMAKRWKLPAIHVCCIGLHIEPLEKIRKIGLDKTSAVPVAISSKVPPRESDQKILKEELELCGLAPSRFEEICDKCVHTLEEIANLFNIKEVKLPQSSKSE